MLINRTQVRAYIKRMKKERTPTASWERISSQALDAYEERLKRWIRDDVERHPETKTFVQTCMPQYVEMLSH